MRTAPLILLVALYAMLSLSPLGAQVDEAPPLLMSAIRDEQFFIEQDLYQFRDNQWQQVTSNGYKSGFSLSPDGSRVAYRAAPDVIREAVESGNDYLVGAVWNIAVLDLASGETRELSGQPSDVALSADGRITNGIHRSAPVWSPDGSAVAWTEQDYPARDIARLVVAGVISGEARVVDDALPQITMSANGLPSFLAWGEPGIVVFTNDQKTNAETLRFYDLERGLLRIVTMPGDGEDWLPVSGLLWVEDGADEVAVVQAGDALWYRVDPSSGDVDSFANRLERVSARQPDASLRLVWDIFAVPGQAEWQLVDAEGTVLASWTNDEMPQDPDAIVMAPFEPEVAYLHNGDIFLWRDGEVEQVALPVDLMPQQLFWVPMQWRAGASYDGIG